MLKIDNLTTHYGNIRALDNVSLNVNPGEIVALIGPNGAGKTTLLKTISGLIKPTAGNIYCRGNEITNLSPEKIAGIGIAHVPEGRHVFTELSVAENLLMGAFIKKNKAEIKEDIQKIYEMFPILKERRRQNAGSLSGGEQQMLVMGRALMSRPQLLLLDEPSMGLAPIIVEKIFSIVKEINKKGTSILLIEQNAKVALSVANRAYVIEVGHIVLTGNAKEMANDENIKKVYLGMEI